MTYPNAMLDTAHSLGALADDILQKSSENNPSYLTDEDIRVLGDISKYVQNTITMIKRSTTAKKVGLAAGVPVGFGMGKLIDTNDNPSGWKTFGAYFAASLASGLTSSFISNMMLKIPNDMGNMTMKAQKFEAALLGKPIDSIIYLENRGLITREQADGYNKKLLEALKTEDSLDGGYKYARYAIAAANAYHGYKRNGDDIVMGLAWLIGTNADTRTVSAALGLAIEQGFAKPIAQG